jgi:hypothetical protein
MWNSRLDASFALPLGVGRVMSIMRHRASTPQQSYRHYIRTKAGKNARHRCEARKDEMRNTLLKVGQLLPLPSREAAVM